MEYVVMRYKIMHFLHHLVNKDGVGKTTVCMTGTRPIANASRQKTASPMRVGKKNGQVHICPNILFLT